MILARKQQEQWEKEWLAPYAVKSAESRGRKYPEKEHDYRTAFQRDRDRIIHSTAFRRLQYKTQVFVNYEGDHYRTRLTHTLETAQIARTIGIALSLNEDLIEAIALAHDLGHGPFGHAGQMALQKLMKDHGGFEHNKQSLRIVEVLEDFYSQFSGLNLTFEVREGLKKHEDTTFFSLEARVVDVADEIAYNSHDLDDGLRSGYLEIKDLGKLSIWNEIAAYLKTKGKNMSDTIAKRSAIRLLINRQVNDVLNCASRQLEKKFVRKSSFPRKWTEQVICFSPKMARQQKELESFLNEELYQHYRVIRMTNKGKRFVEKLFQEYCERPKQLPPNIRERIGKDKLERVICDYIAGMTDRFALDEYKRLFEPYERV